MHRITQLCKVFRLTCRVFFLAILLLLITPSSSISAGYDAEYLNNLVGDAQRLKLSNQHYWDLLVHYRPVSDGRKSMVDDPRFFLSKKGKTDPEAELKATLTGFFAEPVEGKEHVRCRFIARYTWLKEQLQIDESRLPAVACSDFELTLSSINPRSVVLIFPVAYISSPASMFGHTLLRIDGGYESALVSTAVNYAAVTEESMGISYAFKGIFGGYYGYYYSRPYYEKVREYTAIEHRDIWEYSLDLTQEEARRIVLHIWEMRGIKSPYYFFDKNCSFAVLYLLDIARPSLRMIETYESTHHLWVIPSDTVNTVVNSGIVTRVAYRPSQGTRIRSISATLSQEGQRLAYGVATGTADPTAVAGAGMSEDNRTRTLDLASEYIQFLATRRMIGSEEYLSRFQGVMQERSRLGRSSERLFESPTPVQPDEGHLPGRIGIGGGCRTGSCFGEVSLRPAYHDLLDNDNGYVEGAQINFADAALRFYSSDRKLLLQKLDIIDIVSLSPRDIFFQPFSWKIKTGLLQQTGNDGQDHLVYQINPGGGISYKVNKEILLYFLGEADLNYGGGLEGGYAVGIGASAGVLSNLSKVWKVHLYAREIYYALGAKHNAWEAGLQQNFTLSTNTSLRAEVSLSQVFGFNRITTGLFWNFYL